MEELVIGAGIGVVLVLIMVGVYHLGYRSGYYSAYGNKSNAAKMDRKTQVNLAMLRAKELHDAGKKPMEIATTVTMEFPDVAFQALRQAQKLAKEMGIQEVVE